MAAATHRFFADAMLGRLARWLRLLGFDTAYEPGIADADLVRRAAEQRRTILTRDRRLPGEHGVSDVVLLRAEGPLAQLEEIEGALGILGEARLFRRCAICNVELSVVAPGRIPGEVPPAVRRVHDSYRRCARCGRVYWYGSHTRRVRRALAGIGGWVGDRRFEI